MKMNYSKYFETKKRDNGKCFAYLIDTAPRKLCDLVQHVHDLVYRETHCMFPNDWIYWTIMHAFEDLERGCLEDCNIEPDSYYRDLYEWFGENFARDYCDSAVEEDYCDGKDIYKTIACAQQMSMTDIYHAVNHFLETNKEEESANE
jgi:hypothetical protein